MKNELLGLKNPIKYNPKNSGNREYYFNCGHKTQRLEYRAKLAHSSAYIPVCACRNGILMTVKLVCKVCGKIIGFDAPIKRSHKRICDNCRKSHDKIYRKKVAKLKKKQPKKKKNKQIRKWDCVSYSECLYSFIRDKHKTCEGCNKYISTLLVSDALRCKGNFRSDTEHEVLTGDFKA